MTPADLLRNTQVQEGIGAKGQLASYRFGLKGTISSKFATHMHLQHLLGYFIHPTKKQACIKEAKMKNSKKISPATAPDKPAEDVVAIEQPEANAEMKASEELEATHPEPTPSPELTPTPTPTPTPTSKPRLNLAHLSLELDSLKQTVQDHSQQTLALQEALARKRKSTPNGKIQIRDKQTDKVYPSQNSCYRSLLKAGELKDIVDKGVFGSAPEKNTFGWYALVRAWPDRFEEVKA